MNLKQLQLQKSREREGEEGKKKSQRTPPPQKKKMHLSENEGIEGNTFVVTGGLGFIGSALCLELVRRGASQVRAFDLRTTSPWSQHLKNNGVRCVQGNNIRLKKKFLGFDF